MQNASKSKYLVDVVIPSYREESHIQKTLLNLSQQTFYESGLMRIIIADFDDGDHLTRDAVESLKLKYVKYLSCPRKGIAFQRNFGAESGDAPYIVNMDSDAVFRDKDSIERLIQPLEAGLALLTHCTVRLEDHPDVDMFNPQRIVWDTVVKSQLFLPIAQASGLTTTREVFDRVGGFVDVQGEDWYFTSMFVYYYGIEWKIMLPDIVIYASPRRYVKQPLHNMLDYSKGHRNGAVFET